MALAIRFIPGSISHIRTFLITIWLLDSQIFHSKMEFRCYIGLSSQTIMEMLQTALLIRQTFPLFYMEPITDAAKEPTSLDCHSPQGTHYLS